MRSIVLGLFLYSAVLFSQSPPINDKIVKASFEDESGIKTGKRSFTVFHKKADYYNPINYIGATMLFVYQNVFSSQIQAECMYEISCSEFTKLSVQERGLMRGTLMGFNQLSECYGAALYEHPPLFINGRKIINSIDKATK
jgi:putative component of membrane protein insertase Oxa1/YidC/SpoIIIJ protein YidD